MPGVTLIVCPMRSASECPAPIAGDYNRSVLVSGTVSDPLNALAFWAGSDDVAGITYKCIIHVKTRKIVEKSCELRFFRSESAIFFVF